VNTHTHTANTHCFDTCQQVSSLPCLSKARGTEDTIMNKLICLLLWLIVLMSSTRTESPDADPSGQENRLHSGCNERVCASIVGKCILTDACKCDNIRSNRTCSFECKTCLDYFYQDCCLCVGKDRLGLSSHPSNPTTLSDLCDPTPELIDDRARS